MLIALDSFPDSYIPVRVSTRGESIDDFEKKKQAVEAARGRKGMPPKGFLRHSILGRRRHPLFPIRRTRVEVVT